MYVKDLKYDKDIDLISQMSDATLYKDDAFFIKNPPNELTDQHPEISNYFLGKHFVPAAVINSEIFNSFDDSSDENLIKTDLRNDEIKLLIRSDIGFFHFFMDSMYAIVSFSKKFPDATIVIDFSDAHVLLTENVANYNNFLTFLKKYLDFNNIKYKLLIKNYLIAINNFYLINMFHRCDTGINMLYDAVKPFMREDIKNPLKKAYVSRRKAGSTRIDNEDVVEDFFKSKNYDIVYPEDFKSFDDQINYFNNVHTIASTTSSGLINMIFMPPGGTVIDLVSQLKGDIEGYSQIHSFMYLTIAYAKKHLYHAITNTNNAYDLVEYLKNKDNII